MDDPELISCLQNCFKNCQKWDSAHNLQNDIQLFQNSVLKHTNIIDDIVHLLQKIIALYKQVEPNIEDVMKIHPELGPLISSLCKNSSILLHKQCCHLVLEVLLWFYNAECTTELQRYANEWVLDQLSQCLSLQNNYCPQLFGKWEHQFILKQNMKYIVSNKQLLDSPSILTAGIENSEQVEDILETIVQTIPADPIVQDHNPSVSAFLHFLGDNFKKNKIKLSNSGKLKLCKLVPSVIEWELIALLHNAADNNQCIKDHLLFELCISELDISQQVFSILSKLLSDLAFHPLVLKCLKIWFTKIQLHGDVKSYPVQLQHLILLLQVSPSTLAPSEKLIHARNIMKTLYFNHYNKHTAIYEMKAALLLFSQWLIIIFYSMLGQENQSLAMKIIFILHENCNCFVKTVKYLKDFKLKSHFQGNCLSGDANCRHLNFIIILIYVYSIKNNKELLSFVQSSQSAKEFELLSNWVKNHLIASNLFNNKLT